MRKLREVHFSVLIFAFSVMSAVMSAGVIRFRPILLTSMTTFCGLAPMLLEKSTQAQGIVPMAVSLAFGIVFATVITLLLVPCLYLILEDINRLWQRLLGKKTDNLEPIAPRSADNLTADTANI